ncbi:MAG TPA: hypothetical protein VFD39_01070, partial [Trueperaceae bacterium]|nr:hypothetical protein [Trueperaceae bacterium]
MELTAGGLPVSYQGYATADVALTAGAAASADLDLGTALTTATVDLEVVSSEALSATLGAVQVGPSLALPVMFSNTTDTSYEVKMPVIADASYTFGSVTNSSQMGWQAGVTGTAANVTVPERPTQGAPADLATGVTASTAFTASNPAGGPLTYMWNADVGNLAIGLTTMDTSVDLPDISAFGLALPAGADFSWQVIGSSGSSVEDGLYAIGNYYRLQLLASLSSPGPIG